MRLYHRVYYRDLLQRLYHGKFTMETYCGDCHGDLLQRLYSGAFAMETYYRDFTAETLPWRLYHGDLLSRLTTETFPFRVLLQRVYHRHLLWRPLKVFLMPITSLFVLVYHWLPLSTINLVGDKRKFWVIF